MTGLLKIWSLMQRMQTPWGSSGFGSHLSRSIRQRIQPLFLRVRAVIALSCSVLNLLRFRGREGVISSSASSSRPRFPLDLDDGALRLVFFGTVHFLLHGPFCAARRLYRSLASNVALELLSSGSGRGGPVDRAGLDPVVGVGTAFEDSELAKAEMTTAGRYRFGECGWSHAVGKTLTLAGTWARAIERAGGVGNRINAPLSVGNALGGSGFHELAGSPMIGLARSTDALVDDAYRGSEPPGRYSEVEQELVTPRSPPSRSGSKLGETYSAGQIEWSAASNVLPMSIQPWSPASGPIGDTRTVGSCGAEKADISTCMPLRSSSTEMSIMLAAQARLSSALPLAGLCCWGVPHAAG